MYRPKSKNNPVEFCGEIKNESDLAYMVYDGDSITWIPKSQVMKLKPVKNSDFIITIPEWLAIEKGIV